MNIDDQLLTAFNNRDFGALELLYERCYPTVFNYVGKLTKYTSMTPDLANDVFVKIYKSTRTYENAQHLTATIFTISKNTVIDYFRQLRRMSTAINEVRYLDSQIQRVEESGFSGFRGEQFIDWAKTAYVNLPEKQRTTFRLLYIEFKPVKEAADILGVEVSTIHSNRYQAFAKLRAMYAEYLKDHE